MAKQKTTKSQQLIAQAKIEENYQGKEWEPYPQPRAWSMRWDAEGLDQATQSNKHKAAENKAKDD